MLRVSYLEARMVLRKFVLAEALPIDHASSRPEGRRQVESSGWDGTRVRVLLQSCGAWDWAAVSATRAEGSMRMTVLVESIVDVLLQGEASGLLPSSAHQPTGSTSSSKAAVQRSSVASG